MADEVSFGAESLALAKKRHAKAEAEFDRAVTAFLAGAMDIKLYKREQERLQSGIRTAEAEIGRVEAAEAPISSSGASTPRPITHTPVAKSSASTRP